MWTHYFVIYSQIYLELFIIIKKQEKGLRINANIAVRKEDRCEK